MSGWEARLADEGATVITGAAVVIAVLVWMATGGWRPAMPVFLELLLAAGLLRLSAADDWHAIAAAASIVVIRAVIRGTVTASGGLPSIGVRNSLHTGFRKVLKARSHPLAPRRPG